MIGEMLITHLCKFEYVLSSFEQFMNLYRVKVFDKI